MSKGVHIFVCTMNVQTKVYHSSAAASKLLYKRFPCVDRYYGNHNSRHICNHEDNTLSWRGWEPGREGRRKGQNVLVIKNIINNIILIHFIIRIRTHFSDIVK